MAEQNAGRASPNAGLEDSGTRLSPSPPLLRSAPSCGSVLTRSPGPVKLHEFASSMFPPEDEIADPEVKQFTGPPPATIVLRTTFVPANSEIPLAVKPLPVPATLSVTVTFVRVTFGTLLVSMPPVRKPVAPEALTVFSLTVESVIDKDGAEVHLQAADGAAVGPGHRVDAVA